MEKVKVLFVCVHNSARSQMAESFLNRHGGGRFKAESAGLEPGELNPVAVEAMGEIGVDISRNRAKSAFEMYKGGKPFDYVVTVCDEAQAERCPVFPGNARRLHWSFPDPSAFSGTPLERLAQTRAVRDLIEARVRGWIGDIPQPGP